ncbi:hypothetical protein CU254_31240 [Amycolatopsis sp. AA4]|uniref:hypothetical protein n=1 Tax=Actinomycetes TaxID=1760 RepID=UPI0001B53B0F|nr:MULTISPECIES: hypothetical protein [Actinomycetes]ATY14396.1 hypothetical protein CU254_31240 [Amycolatopsis sp. AA4]EFL10481.1 hypothetical protein SSMG_06152 [Streptomyces sp. AA4]
MYPLAEDERLLWSGRPQRYVRRYRDYHYYVTVGILVLVVSALAAVLDLSRWAMIGWIVVFSLFITSGFERNRERRGFIAVTTYLVTDRRLIFVSESPPGIEFRWVQLADLGKPRVRDHGDGTGTIDFHPTTAEWLRDQGFRSRPAWHPILPELMAVPDAAHVAELISRNAPRSPAVG